MVNHAEIFIWDVLVGGVVWDDRNQYARFEYDAAFLKKGWDIAPIKMPISNSRNVYAFPELRKGKNEALDTFKGLPGLLADSLPDKYGNLLMNIWLARQGRLVDSMNPLEQLCFIGERAMGALEYRPSLMQKANAKHALEVGSLVETAHEMLQKRGRFKTKIKHKEQGIKEVLQIGTSAGGARPKAVVAYHPEKNEFRSGQLKAPEGFEYWLLKLDGVSNAQFGNSMGWGNVEYAYHLMAKAAGIQMMDCQLIEENGRAHFMTKRFDRDLEGNKHHVQTFCALQHFDFNDVYGYSYEQLFQTMRILRLTYPEAEQMFRRMVFNVVATNCDDHTKNFSFLLKKNGRWELSPAYDVCYAFDPNNIWVNQHSLSIHGKYRDINMSDVMQIAKSNNIKKAEKIIKEINDVVKSWAYFANKAKVPQELNSRIQKHLYMLK